MANFDQPNGFTPLSPNASARKVTLGGTVTKGDPLARVSGAYVLYDASSHDAIAGVAAESGTSGEEIFAYTELQDLLFRTQVVTGTYAVASHDGNRYDITGATGATGLDLSATTRGECELVEHSPITGASAVGADARVAVKFVKLASADIPATINVNTINEATAASGVTVDGVLLKDSEVSTDVINEKTSAAGVTVDGVLLKDSEVSTDVINEKTSAAGVTVDGVLLKDSEVSTDVINEKTSATGVTIDGVLLKDSEVTTDVINEKTSDTGVTIDGMTVIDGAIENFGAAALTGDTVKAAIGIGDSLPGNSEGYGKGSLFIALDTGTAKLYVNTGTDASVTWAVAGTQT